MAAEYGGQVARRGDDLFNQQMPTLGCDAERRSGDADGGDDLSSMVANGRADAAQPFFKFFVIDGETELAHLGKLVAIGTGVTNGLFCEFGEAVGAQNLIDLRRRLKGHEQFALRRAMNWAASADGRGSAHRMLRFNI